MLLIIFVHEETEWRGTPSLQTKQYIVICAMYHVSVMRCVLFLLINLFI